MSDPRLEVANALAAASFEDLRDIARSLHDMATDTNMLRDHVEPINLVEFLHDWAQSVIEYNQDEAAAAEVGS